MQNSGTILCPVDFSELSRPALQHAAAFAACAGAGIIAAYANWFEAPPYFTQGRMEALERESRESSKAARRMLDSMVNSTPGMEGVKVESKVVEGMPVEVILSLAASSGARLIVMGTHGRTGVNRWMLGSVAERVLRESPVPVLTVRQALPRPIRHILCPVNDSDASRHALRAAADVAECSEGTLTALHVVDGSGHGAIPNLCGWISAEQRARCVIRETVRHGNAAEEIIRVAAEESYDLVVLGARHRRFFEGMVLSTTTLRAVRHAPCPVLSVPEPASE